MWSATILEKYFVPIVDIIFPRSVNVIVRRQSEVHEDAEILKFVNPF